MTEEILWLDDFKGKAEGGFFVRSDLFKTIENFEKAGKKVVGIKKPTDWNLELICEVEEDKK